MTDQSSPGSPPIQPTDYDVKADSVGAGTPGPATDYNVVGVSAGPGSPLPATDYNVVGVSAGPGSPLPATDYKIVADTDKPDYKDSTLYAQSLAPSAAPGNTPLPEVAKSDYKDPADYKVVRDGPGGGWKFPGMNPLLLNPVVDQSEFTMYPPIISNFMVAIDGVSCGVWTEMSGLAMEYTGKAWTEGGQVTADWLLQPRKQQTLTLSRPIGPASIEMLAWFQLYGHVIIPLTAFVGLCDFQGNICYWWELMGVTPLKWTGPKGKAGAPDAAIETLVLTYTDFLAYGPGPGLGAAGAIGAAIGAGVGIAASVGEAVVSALTAPKLSASASAGGSAPSLSGISGGLSSLMGGGGITFDIVPQSYKISAKAGTVPHPAAGGSKGQAGVQYKGAQPRTLNFQAIFDCMTFHITNPMEMISAVSSGVQPQLDFLYGCLGPTPDSLGTVKPLPPTVTFTWGSLKFSGWLTSVDVQVDIFRIDGTPMRATVTINIQEVVSDTQGQNPTSAASGAKKTHTVVAGDSLPLISYATYGRSDYWRSIAKLNGIDDPARIKPGMSLLLPPPTMARATA